MRAVCTGNRSNVLFWCPDFRVILLAAAFPSLPRTVANVAVFVADHSGGAVPDSHQLPTTSRLRFAGPIGRLAEEHLHAPSNHGTIATQKQAESLNEYNNAPRRVCQAGANGPYQSVVTATKRAFSFGA